MKGAVVVGIMITGQFPFAEAIDTAERRRQFPQFTGKGGQLLRLAFGAYGDAVGIVQDITGKAVAQRQSIDEGAKTDSLHYAVEMELAAQPGARPGPVRHGAILRGVRLGQMAIILRGVM
ncbi:hypothetical protein D3C87_1316690 [compost metagenome]